VGASRYAGVVGGLLLYIVPSPTPAGCHPVTPPPGSFGAGECNFDQQFGAVGNVMMALDLFVLAPIAVLLVAVGIFALVTAKGPLPHAITKALPREPDSSRDHRLQGLSLTLGGLGILVATLAVSREISKPSLPPPPHPDFVGVAAISAVLVLFLGGVLIGLAVRQRDHRTSEVLNGWQQIAKTFRD